MLYWLVHIAHEVEQNGFFLGKLPMEVLQRCH